MSDTTDNLRAAHAEAQAALVQARALYAAKLEALAKARGELAKIATAIGVLKLLAEDRAAALKAAEREDAHAARAGNDEAREAVAEIRRAARAAGREAKQLARFRREHPEAMTTEEFEEYQRTGIKPERH